MGGKRSSYQRLDDLEKLAIARTGKTLADLLTAEELEGLRTVFQKRHVNTHIGGLIDERFVREFEVDPDCWTADRVE